MTILELEKTLPGGFHDALLHSYNVDLVGQIVELRLELCVGNPHSLIEAEREAYRSAILKLSGLTYFFVEAPDPRYQANAPWCVDLCDADPKFDRTLPPGTFTGRFFSASTNSFIHFAALNASVTYADQA